MDVDELYLDLLALRKLYILLLKTCLRDANSELLDERAQILLKHLLDDATTGLLEFLSKDLATNSNIFYNFLRKDEEQTKPLDDNKVLEWMKQNQTAKKMGNPEIRNRASASNVAINDLSHGISSALRRIELHILSMQNCTSQSRNSRSHWQSVLQGNESLNQQKVQPRTDPSTLKSRFTNSIKGRGHFVGEQKVKPITTYHCSEFVHGFRIPLNQSNDEAMKPPTIETHLPKQHKVVNPMTLIDRSGYTSVGSKATFRPAMKPNQTSTQRVKRNQNSYGQMIMGPTLLDHHSKEARKEKTHNKTHLATEQESEFTNSEFESAASSSSSSSWTTQQTSESETVDDDGDNDSSSPSHQDNPSATDSKSSSRYSTKTFNIKHGKREESKRAIGRFKRLKNKLGVIFHHHHHHHHHHHNNHNFMWKQLRKIFHHRDNKRLLVSKEDRSEKVKKRAIRKVCYKNQVGKFQALAEGLRSHVWRSKAMKRKELKGGMKCGKKKKEKGVKKLHWWKMFHNRRGVKFPNKGRMKIGYVNRKTQL